MFSQCSSSTLPPQTPHPGLLLTDVLVEIFSHVRTPHELLHYRLVCRKWNEAAVHTLVTKRKKCFPLLLRLRHVPTQSLLSSLRAKVVRLTREILESPNITLTGTTIPLSFDTVVVDSNFYLAGINPEWQHFLSIYGQSIRHLKFNIRSGRNPDNSQPVVSCAQVVSTQNLRAAFSAVSNLESLDFSIRFTHYGTHPIRYGGEQRMFPEAREISDLPQMARLTKIIIQEPHGVQYLGYFLKEIIGMAPNLTTLYIKYSKDLSKFASVMRGLPHLNNSLTTLGITMADRCGKFDIQESGFSRFHLTKLELNCVSGNGRHLETFLQSQSSTLITLILGDRVKLEGVEPGYHGRCRGIYLFGGAQSHTCETLYDNPLSLPPIMNSLKILELNLSKFKVNSIISYSIQFPALEELSFSNCEETACIWTYQQLHHVLLGENGQSHTLKKFSLLGQMCDGDRNTIIDAVRFTFPLAEYDFGL